MQVTRHTALVCTLAAMLLSATALDAANARAATARLAPRERILLDDGWRFHAGDPDGDSAPYLYDVRPAVTVSADGKVADAVPEEAARVAGAGAPVLKPWILPTGNAFIHDPARRHARPAAAPPVDAPFARAAFDDATWRASPCRTTGPSRGRS